MDEDDDDDDDDDDTFSASSDTDSDSSGDPAHPADDPNDPTTNGEEDIGLMGPL